MPFGNEAAVHVSRSAVWAFCWLCKWSGERHDGRGRMKRAQLAMSLHSCSSPRFHTREQALAAGETL